MSRPLRLIRRFLLLPLCTLLALIALAFWISGARERWACARHGRTLMRFTAEHRHLRIDLVPDWPDKRNAPASGRETAWFVHWQQSSNHRARRYGPVVVATDQVIIPTRMGKLIDLDQVRNADATHIRRAFEITVPMSYLALTFSLPPILWSIAWLRRDLHAQRSARRQAQGLCLQCAYDLRATPTLCPECGQTYPAPPPRPPPSWVARFRASHLRRKQSPQRPSPTKRRLTSLKHIFERWFHRTALRMPHRNNNVA